MPTSSLLCDTFIISLSLVVWNVTLYLFSSASELACVSESMLSVKPSHAGLELEDY